jgi:hypothetical protein
MLGYASVVSAKKNPVFKRKQRIIEARDFIGYIT